MPLYLWGSCRSSPALSHSAWPARSYSPDRPQHTGGCCSSSGQSSGTLTKMQTKTTIQSFEINVFVFKSLQLSGCFFSSHSRRARRSTSSCRCPWGSSGSVRSKTSAARPRTPCGPHGNISVVLVSHVMSLRLRALAPTRRPRGGPAEQSAPPRGR